MACFTAPLAEAVVVSVVKHTVCKNGKNAELASEIREKAGWLEKMLYGGSFLLAVEHAFHGEITCVPPFLTALSSPEATEEMLHEIATAGVGMALLVTAAWGAMVGISLWAKKRARKIANV